MKSGMHRKLVVGVIILRKASRLSPDTDLSISAAELDKYRLKYEDMSILVYRDDSKRLQDSDASIMSESKRLATLSSSVKSSHEPFIKTEYSIRRALRMLRESSTADADSTSVAVSAENTDAEPVAQDDTDVQPQSAVINTPDESKAESVSHDDSSRQPPLAATSWS